MRVVSWNVNSVRARLPLLIDLIDAESPDVICLQETRCHEGQFPIRQLAARGYETVAVGNGPRAGVSISSRVGLTDIQRGFGGTPVAPFDEPRLVAATVKGTRIVTVYAPNGRKAKTRPWQVKLLWFELLRNELALELRDCEAANMALVVVGDFNVCPTLDDVYDPVKKRNRNLVTAEERAAFAALCDIGVVDVARSLHGAHADYTWFSYVAGQFANNRGYRLDVALASQRAAGNVRNCEVLTQWRDPNVVERPSDHAPLVVDLRAC